MGVLCSIEWIIYRILHNLIGMLVFGVLISQSTEAYRRHIVEVIRRVKWDNCMIWTIAIDSSVLICD